KDPHVTAHTGEFAKGTLHRDQVPRVAPDSQYAVGTRDQVPRVAPDSQYAVGTRDQVPRVAPDSQYAVGTGTRNQGPSPRFSARSRNTGGQQIL
ncbi:hypothetical protein THAOC_32868, partial [Thalassiosira oceanica]